MKTRIAITDERISDACHRGLQLRGFNVITLPRCSTLGEPVSAHPDMLLARVSGEFITTADYCETASSAISMIYDNLRTRFHFTSDIHGSVYPADVLFNSLTMGKRLFGRLDSLSPYLKEVALSFGYELINTNQGYPACTTLKLSDDAVITADDGMERVLADHGIRVYKIKNGGISLPPYEYGFIGGTAGVFDGKVYFLGNAMLHPSADVIMSAIKEEGLSAVMLSDSPLTDLGGILFAEGDVN